jgi:hypothetical protein
MVSKWSHTNDRRENVPQIPVSFILIGQVALVPLIGVTAALVASRIPSLRSDI